MRMTRISGKARPLTMNAPSTHISSRHEPPVAEAPVRQDSTMEQLIQRSYWMADRGPRPLTRGWGHFFAAILSVIASTVLITFAWMTLPWWQGLAVTVYGVGAVSYTHLTLPTKA